MCFMLLFNFFIDVPEEEPVVTVDRLRYSAGDRIRANCSSSLSYPAANITWFVNEQKVNNVIFIRVSFVFRNQCRFKLEFFSCKIYSSN